MNTNILLGSKYPFHKMDTNNSRSFSITDLTITTEPTNPATPTAGSPIDTYVGAPFTEALTLVYTFNHGYNYVPSTWFMISIDNFSTIIGYEGYLIAGNYTSLASSHSIFEIQVTSTAVNFYVRKKRYYVAGSPTAVQNITGTVVSIRSYIFVEDLTGTSIL